MPKMSGSQITMEVLVREGVEHIFGYPGGAIMPIYDAMLDYKVHHILTRHERGVANGRVLNPSWMDDRFCAPMALDYLTTAMELSRDQQHASPDHAQAV